MFYLYVIEDRNSWNIYIGQTNNLQNRINRHNGCLKQKKGSYTKRKEVDWQFIYIEAHPTRKDVLLREKQLKTARGRDFLKQFRNANE